MFLILTGVAVLVVSLILKQCRKRRKRLKRGSDGEKIVHHQLLKLPKRKYKVLNNVLLPTNYGTTQIDHIVISRYGIFVIETKNYRGRIFGTENDEYWTQYLYEERHKFYNPIKQNKAHLYAIRSIIKDCEDVWPSSIITFSEECSLEVFTETPVVYFSDIKKFIRTYKKKQIRKQSVKQIYAIIVEKNITLPQAHKEHVSMVKSNIKTYEDSIKRRVCPKCGRKLVKRRRKHKRVLRCKDKKHCGFIYRIIP